MDELTLTKLMRQRGIDLSKADSTEESALLFERALKLVIEPKDQSDRTSFRRIAAWLRDGCETGRFNDQVIFRRVLDYALEASGPACRKPAAVFTAILKKELGYKR